MLSEEKRDRMSRRNRVEYNEMICVDVIGAHIVIKAVQLDTKLLAN
jgi:hypothetical protein